MLRRSFVAGVAVTAAVAAALAGCFIVTGSTNGYHAVDAGAPPCSGTSDCQGGELCCVDFESLSTGLPVCQKGPCALAQLCKNADECGDAGVACAVQSCQIDASTVTLQACGVLGPCSFR